MAPQWAASTDKEDEGLARGLIADASPAARPTVSRKGLALATLGIAAVMLVSFVAVGTAAAAAGSGGGGQSPAAGVRGPFSLAAAVRERGMGRGGAVSDAHCKTCPTKCEPPFNCDSDPLTPEELNRMENVAVATEDGHANLRWFCTVSYPENEPLMKTCIKDRDLPAAAKALYKVDFEKDGDASYCFQQGLCAMTEVTDNFTVEQAEAVCDAKYGHENWTSLSMASAPEDIFKIFATLASTRSPELSSWLGMFGCAIGTFHCDVVLCRDFLCKEKKYVEKYGHYLKEYGYRPLE